MPKLSVAQYLALSFAVVILVGAVALWLPACASRDHDTSFVDALFTSTSAVCVTGLAVVDTGTHFSRAGHVALIVLIQVGGLSIITFSILAILAMGGDVSLRFRIMLKEALNRVSLRNIVEVALAVMSLTLFLEGVGALLLFLRWRRDLPPFKALFYAVFHSVSAFCNAGFSLFPDNLASYVGDPAVNFTIGGLIILGGIGFTVLLELILLAKKRRLSVHSKLAVTVTVLLIVVGTVGVYFFELRHTPTFRTDLTEAERWLAAWFQSVTARTAGFNTLDIGAMSDASLFFIILLMFIGASPGSTGGGIKTTTFGCLVATFTAVVRGESDVQIFRRRVPQETLVRAFMIGLVSAFLVGLVTLLILWLQPRRLLDILFEVTSAFGTVGLSTGITPHLTTAEKLLIIVTMFCGRVGPLTLAVAFAESRHRKAVRFPEGSILIG